MDEFQSIEEKRNAQERWLAKVDQYLAEISDYTVYDAIQLGWDFERAWMEHWDNPYAGLETVLEWVELKPPTDLGTGPAGGYGDRPGARW